MEKKKKAKIPKLEIEKFTFSPPGRMGWSYSEYESMMDNPEKTLKESDRKENQVELTAELMEFPFGLNTEFNWEEEMETASAAIKLEVESAEEIWNDDFAASFNEQYDESVESLESYDYVKQAEVESAEDWDEAEEIEEIEESAEETVAKEKKQIIVVTMEPPKPPWIANNLKRAKIIKK
ncbi:MAG TPA: hypothetical protein VNM69_14440 [Bacillus sp. (in: firmicutes)]|uniref:hypothetical protein n=1 Tax=Bacillus litorisediminis TaxID=2922713 RepID=UPI001FAD3FD3|nr:hypothetical protein [Bacillus litorisediminis]HWO77072.1 hypothetical protein [Bacillus sp. (in: firmicutes)]